MLKRLALMAMAAAALSLSAAPAAPAAPSGQLFAFGNNSRGQLGSTTNIGTFNAVPGAVTLPGATGPVTDLAAGVDHSLAVTSTGQLFAFGSNDDGQLGTATAFETETPNPVPTLVSLPGATGPVIDAAVGVKYSLALTSTGQVFGFGDNYFGQLGRAANNGSFSGVPFAALASVPGPVTQIAAGYGFTLAVTSAGQLYSFGRNYYGALGRDTNKGTDNPNPKPELVVLPGATGPVTQVAAGEGQSLALTSTGQLYAWGGNAAGALGLPTNVGNSTPNTKPALVSLPGATGPVTQVAAGYEHSLVLTSTGQIYTFGKNGYGELGRALNSGNFDPNPTPGLVTLSGLSGQATQISGGQHHSLVRTSGGQVYAFGSNKYGQLGIIANSETNNPNPTPTLVPLAIPAGMSVADISEGPVAAQSLVAFVAPSTPSTDPPPAASRPRATAAKQAIVKNGKAMVLLTCPGPTACSGKLVLKAKLKAGKKAKKGSAGASAKKRKAPKPTQIGTAAFSIPAGKKRTIAVSLKPKALAKVKAAGKAGLKAQLSGDGIKPGPLTLKAAPRKPSKR